MNYIIPKCKIQLLGFTLSSNSILVNNSSFCSFSETDMEMDVSEQNNIEHVSSIISMERYDSQPLNSSLPELRRSNRLVLMLDLLFSSNHNIHKSSYGLCFWASDPLI